MNFLSRLFRLRNNAPNQELDNDNELEKQVKLIEEYCRRPENKADLIRTSRWLKEQNELAISHCANKIIQKYPSLSNTCDSFSNKNVGILTAHYCLGLKETHKAKQQGKLKVAGSISTPPPYVGLMAVTMVTASLSR
jgi:hypothetical protein